MKILMIPSWYPTPQMPMLGTFYKEQAEALAAGGAEVAVIYADVNGRLHGNGTRWFTENGVRTCITQTLNLTPGRESGRVWQRTALIRRAYKRLLKEWGRPDVVNLRSSLQGYEALALCRAEKLPLFFMEHSSVILTEPAESAAHRRLAAVMDYAAVSACVSSALKKAMAPYGEVRVIPDLVDTARFSPMLLPREGESFRFRAMGQLRPIKGYDTLIRAFGELRRSGVNATLEIAGAGVLREELSALIAEQQVADSCRLVGVIPREQTPQFMNGCDCFICSSRHETLSCVLNEAASCGKPVISTRCGGPEDIVTEELGLLVPVDDTAALSAAMRQMTECASSYSAQQIRELTIARFGVDSVCDRLLLACQDAAKKEETR